MGYGLLNLCSLILGLISWIIPFVTIRLFDRNKVTKGVVFSYISYVCCILSLFFVITYNNYLVRIKDWSALMDTTKAFQIAIVILTVITCVLNAVSTQRMIKTIKNNIDNK